RWLYALQKPENNLLFGYNRADEVRRQFLIPLWNVYNFFVSYARLDGWEPPTEGFNPGAPEGTAPLSDHPMDRWIIARVNAVTDRVTNCLQESDPSGASQSLQELLDDLTDWYVRRNRRRFWKSERDDDKRTAYATLYYVLVRMIRLLAPFTPFITEVMYQNLVRAVQPRAYESVHHTDWPVAEMDRVDEAILGQMALARRIASLGLGARNSVNIKVRQPLAKAFVYIENARGDLSPDLLEIVRDELNVKAIEFVEEEGRLVTYRLTGEGRLLGPRLGRLYPQVRAALAAIEPGPAVRALRAGQSLVLHVAGETVELAPEEVIIHAEPLQGLALASDRGITVAIDATLTDELLAEGLVRDLVRYVQTLRKEADYDLDDRIMVGAFGLDEKAAAALAQFGDYFRQETLCTALLTADDGAPWDAQTEVTLSGSKATLAVRRMRA
ncbi:MAG: class I tRNA ligase family protein, partial [Chloroflexi bacterium]|nr:class I tRNA ligase family protein [Chloroflexota bacterium]